MTTLTNEPKTFCCRHCGANNRILPSVAGPKIHKIRCGSCSANLFFDSMDPLTGIAPSAFEHPLDHQALRVLRKVPGTNSLLKFIISELSERRLRMLFQQTALKISAAQVPRLHALLEQAAANLDIYPVPELFISQSSSPNAFAIGVDKPFIVITTDMLDLLDDNQILGVLGHELGHILAGHQLYRTALFLIIHVAEKMMNRLLPITGAASMAIYHALMHWNRCSELTADRAGMLAQRDFNSFIQCEMKMAGGCRFTDGELSTQAFLEQALEATKMQEENFLNKVYADIQTSNTTHPFPVWRAGHMQRWVIEGNYLDILAGDYQRRLDKKETKPSLDDESEKTPKAVKDLIDNLKGFLKGS